MGALCFCFLTAACRDNEIEQELRKYTPMTHEDYLYEYSYLTDENHLFKSLEYQKMMDMIKNKQSFFLYVGGAWCPNCQAVIKYINQVFKNNNIETIYNFDTRIASTKLKEDDIRNKSNTSLEKLYIDFVNALDFYDADNEENPQRMSVPTILVIKEGKMTGFLSKEYLYDEQMDVLYDPQSLDKLDCKEQYILELETLLQK